MWLLLITSKANGFVGESLADKIRNGTLDTTSMNCMMISLVKGTYELHSKGILNLSLTPSSVLFTPEGFAKIRDFGSVRGTQDDPLEASRYSAPELLEGDPPSEKSDVWALGLLLYETNALEPAFDPTWSIAKHIRLVNSGERPSIPSTASTELVQVIRSCWEADPAKRMKVAEIVELLKGAEWRMLKGADEEAVKSFVDKFPLDLSATKKELLSAVADRDQQLTEATRQLGEREGEVASQKATIASQEATITSLTQELASRDATITSLTQEMASRDATPISQAEELAALKAGVPAATAPGAPGQMGTPGTLLHANSDALVALGLPKASSPQLLLSKGAGPWDIEDFTAVAIGKARTLLLIESEFGAICGGFAAAPWPAESWVGQVDATLASFIFCLGATPQRFGLLADGRNSVGWCNWGGVDCVVFGFTDLSLRSNGRLWVRQQAKSYGGTGRVLERFTGTADDEAAVARWELWQL
jgi:hypothetical protein